MNPFEMLKDQFLLHFPNGGDVVFVAGKTSRVMFFMAVLFCIIIVRNIVHRLSATTGEVQGLHDGNPAYSVNQALVFFGTAIALWAPYAKVSSISWLLVEGVLICLLVQIIVLVALRLVSPSLHHAMMTGRMAAGVTMGLYSVAAGIGTNAVLYGAL